MNGFDPSQRVVGLQGILRLQLPVKPPGGELVMTMNDSMREQNLPGQSARRTVRRILGYMYCNLDSVSKPNVKVLYLGEKGICVMETRVRLQEETGFVFHNVICLKFTKSI